MTGDGAVAAEEHLRWILDRVPVLAAQVLPLDDAVGLLLAEDVASLLDLPIWDNSAMDGYAVRSADLAAATAQRPLALRVVGEVAAGSPEDPSIAPGETVRIMTGAPMPSAADAVVPVERTSGDTPGEPWARAEARFSGPVAPGTNVRRRAEDVAAGAVIARAGSALGAARIAALAAAGVSSVGVRPRPRVAVLVTGSELSAPGTALERGRIPESNSLLLRALLAEQGIDAVEVGTSVDDPDALATRLSELGRRVDLVLTTGGVGPGRHDVVRLALEREPGVRPVRVAVRPGQPQCAGRLDGGAWIFALPGNPVSAAVSFELFVRPALHRMQGGDGSPRLRLPAVAEIGWRGPAGRLQVLPVRIDSDGSGLRCAPAVDPGGFSHAVGGHGTADGYAMVPVGRGDVVAGEAVDVILVGR
ncbi:gephyrin-like molybdotransferase Glp [Leucobacter sp. HNU]|uniref:molybdopterin molybdotransferase MoeA n=1 Tax=Leucobacter sp. HNU TaxID=3236805 RepID=UPI003A806C80